VGGDGESGEQVIERRVLGAEDGGGAEAVDEEVVAA
jgi:hypothetical protein